MRNVMTDEYMKSNNENFGPQLVVLSAERTLLSWLRLALSLMGLGFILDRFGLFIRMKEAGSSLLWLPKSYTFWMGIGLVIIGSFTSAVAGYIYTRLRLNYARRKFEGPKGSMLLSAVSSILITAIGLITAVFLATITD